MFSNAAAAAEKRAADAKAAAAAAAAATTGTAGPGGPRPPAETRTNLNNADPPAAGPRANIQVDKAATAGGGEGGPSQAPPPGQAPNSDVALAASTVPSAGAAVVPESFAAIPWREIEPFMDDDPDNPYYLGRGAFCEVFKGTWNNLPVALKVRAMETPTLDLS